MTSLGDVWPWRRYAWVGSIDLRSTWEDDPVPGARTLLEREAELDLLTCLLRDITVTGGKVVLVRGEAGIGKTALVREFLARSSDEAHILFGRCDDLLTPRPFGPFWDMGRLEPSLEGLLEAADRSSVMDTLLDLLSRGIRPTVMVIEDTQWADEATLDVVGFLGRRVDVANGLLLLTFRDTEVDLEHPLRAVLGGLPPDRVVRIRLGGLSLPAVASLIGESGLDADEVMSLSDGNPFLVTAFASVEGKTVPSSVQDAVLARLRKLSSPAQDLAKVMSVIPEWITRDELTRMGHGIDSGLEECERVGMLDVEGESIGFHHELTRRAVEASLTETEKIDLNRTVLASLPAGTDPSRLVHHARAANDIDRLIEEAPRAARAAMALESPKEAVDHFRQLIPYVDRLDAKVKGQIFEDWALAELNSTSVEEAMYPNRLALEHYRAVSDLRGQSRTLADSALLAEWHGRRHEADRLAQEAIDVLGPDPDPADLVKPLEKKSYLAMMAGDAAAAIQWADRALEAQEMMSISRFWSGVSSTRRAQPISTIPTGRKL